MTRRKTDGELIVERLRSHVYVQNDASGHIPAVYIQEVEIARYIDRLIRRRMAKAWKEIERQRDENARLHAQIVEYFREVERLLAEVERLREEMQSAKADAWDEGYQDHKQMIEGIARKPSNPYR